MLGGPEMGECSTDGPEMGLPSCADCLGMGAVSMCMGLNVLSVAAICSALCFYYVAVRCS